MQADVERTLGDLRVLAALSPYDKLSTSGDALDIHPPGTLREVWRTLCGEGRARNMQRVRQTMRSAIEAANSSLDDANVLLGAPRPGEEMRIDAAVLKHVRLCEALRAASHGLRHLVRTYAHDAVIVSLVQQTVVEAQDYLSIVAPHTERLKSARASAPPSAPPAAPLSAWSPPLAPSRSASSLAAAPSASSDPPSSPSAGGEDSERLP